MGRHRPWEPEETEFVRANLGVLPVEEIAAKLDRTCHAVTSHAAFKNIRSARPRKAEPIAQATFSPPDTPARRLITNGILSRGGYDPTPCMERDLDYVR